MAVSVATKLENGTTVPNCEVFANGIANGNDESNALRFSQLSTPTTESLAVGRYNMWAVKGNLKGPIDVISVGNLSGVQRVDLFAPERSG